MSWTTFDNTAAGTGQVAAWSGTIDALRAFQDALVSAAPGAAMLDEITADLSRWAAALAPMAVPEVDRLSGRLPSLPVRGQAMIPPFVVDVADASRLEGVVTFGPYHLGGGAAAHGGMIVTVFDEVLGSLAAMGGRKPARTAYLTTDFRAIVPIGEQIRVRAWFDREDGRKRHLRAEMWCGETLCAEADSLFVELRETRS